MSIRNAQLARLKGLFLDEMVKTKSAPKGVDQVMLLGIYADDLAEFTDEVIRAAYTSARREHKFNTWVPPEEIRRHALSMVGGTVHRVVDDDAWTPKDEYDVSPRDLQVNNKAAPIVADFLKRQRNPAIIGNPQVRDYLNRMACKQIRAGQEVELKLPDNLTAISFGSSHPSHGTVGSAAGRALDEMRGA